MSTSGSRKRKGAVGILLREGGGDTSVTNRKLKVRLHPRKWKTLKPGTEIPISPTNR